MRRRSFLKGAVATAAIAPLTIDALARTARADGLPKAIFVFVPDGCIPSRWHASGGETSFTLPDMSAPLEAIRDKCVFIKGLDMVSGGATHEGGTAKVLTGVSDTSIDTFLGQRCPSDSGIDSLHLGVHATFQNGSGSMTYLSGTQVQPEDNPLVAFDRVFAGATGGTDPGDAAAEMLRVRRRQSVLDVLAGDVGSLRTRLGATERVKLETHLESIRVLERRLLASSGGGSMGGCTDLRWNEEGFAVSPTDYYPKTYHMEEHFEVVGKLQMDLMALALGCGRTRVASLMWSHAVSPTRIGGATMANHDASHCGDPRNAQADQFVQSRRWLMERFVYLVQKLDSMPSGAGTVLDDTTIMLCTELGDSNLHDHRNMPFVVAGGAAGRLRGGRFLDYSGSHEGGNDAHTKLLVSMARAMGVSVDTYGYSGHGAGPLEGLLSA